MRGKHPSLTNPYPPAYPAGINREAAVEHAARVNDFAGLAIEANGNQNTLRDILIILRRRRRIAIASGFGVMALTILITVNQRLFHPEYQGGFTLLISDPINSSQQNSSSLGSGTLIEQVATNTRGSDLPTLVAFLQSPLLLNPIIARNPESGNSLNTLKIITGGGPKDAQGILRISLNGSNQQRTKALLDDLANTYLLTATEQRQERLEKGIKFLNSQMPLFQNKSNDLQQQLATFRKRHKILDPTTEGAQLKTKMQSQSDLIIELQEQRSKLLSARKQILSGKLTANSYQEAFGGSTSGTLSVVDANQSLLEQMTKLDTELAEGRAIYTPSSAMLKGLEARRQRLMPLLRKSQLEAAAVALKANQRDLAVAKKQQVQFNSIFNRNPELIKEYETLQQKLTIANENYQSLIQAKSNFQLEIAQKAIPWKLIAPVDVSSQPVKPSIPNNLALGALLAVAAGVWASILRDRFDTFFHTPDEVYDSLKLTSLAHIPYVEFFKGVREDGRFLIDELDQNTNNKQTLKKYDANENSTSPEKNPTSYQRFYYQEAFRNLYTSIRFLDSDRPLRSITLTSSIPGEGKSLVNVLLAKTLSEMGKRVLLIDADMRKPQLHTRLGLNNLVGLSNILTDESTSWQDNLQQVKNYDNWAVITSGTRPPDPTRLLGSSRMHQLTQEIEQSKLFDLVIYDSPPVLGLSDALLISEHVHGLILLVSLEVVDRRLPTKAIQRIQQSNVPIIGMVTNAVKAGIGIQPGDQYGYGGYRYNSYDYRYGDYSQTAYSYYTDSKEPTADSANDLKSNYPRRLIQAFKVEFAKLVKWIEG